MGQKNSKGKRERVNCENAVVPFRSTENAVSESSLMVLKLNETVESLVRRMDSMSSELETLKSLERRMDKMEIEIESLEKRINIIHEKEFELQRKADEVISTSGNNVQLIMLFHGLVSVFLQVSYPHVGVWIAFSMVVCFFSASILTLIVTFNKTERMSQLASDLQWRLGELQNEATHFGAKIENMVCYDQQLKTLARFEPQSHGDVLNKMTSLNRRVATLRKVRPVSLDLSNSNQMKLLFQIAVVAIIYGLTFPMMAYFLVYYVFGIRSRGLINM